jgi:hypothetical protein
LGAVSFLALRRREFVSSLAGALAWPFAVRAQQAERMRRIDVLMAYAESDLEGQALVAAFREGLQHGKRQAETNGVAVWPSRGIFASRIV